MNPDFLLLVPILVMSVVVHEVAHAWQARREGDPTADELGRITLNPIPHLDPVGSLIVPIFLYLATEGMIFGWARPVPVNPARFRSHPWGDVRVSLAGIVANLLLALLCTLVAAGTAALGGTIPAGLAEVLQRGAFFGIFINLLLAFFNLLPIPPLDGSHVLAQLLPARWRARYAALGRIGIPLLLVLVFVVPGALRVALAPVFWLMGIADAFVRLWI
ncbi:MAG: site-2 protease family protein [Longimicrobiales bacterium]|nr:site-2 protease family protein [Longimicrobiales bacterium]